MYGSKIASIRLARGYTQDYVAKKIGIDQRTYSKIEKDEKATVDNDLLEKIAAALGVSPDDIKSPTPIVMTFHNSPYSGQLYSTQNNTIDTSLIDALRQELKEKNEQIARLMSLLEK